MNPQHVILVSLSSGQILPKGDACHCQPNNSAANVWYVVLSACYSGGDYVMLIAVHNS